jgi:Zn-dependent peptidase ImmA (M78 family)
MTLSEREVLSKAHTYPMPVPVVDVAKTLGISVYQESEYNENRDGHIEIDGDGRPAIIVNAHKPAVRKRFTISHEIAHFIHDKDYLMEHGSIDRNGRESDSSYREREVRANQFAAKLLMPESLFIEQWTRSTLDDVANYFGVSQEAAHYRAASLGLVAIR